MKLRVVAVLTFLLACFWFGYQQGSSRVQAKFDQYKASVSSESALAAERNALAQAEVSSSFQKTLEWKQSEVQKLSLERDALLSRLRNRPSREASGDTSGASQGDGTTHPTGVTGCSPEQLYREDAEFLARLAADAEEVRLELLNTRDTYTRTKEVLEKGTGTSAKNKD